MGLFGYNTGSMELFPAISDSQLDQFEEPTTGYRLCTYFEQNRCSRGRACLYSHNPEAIWYPEGGSSTSHSRASKVWKSNAACQVWLIKHGEEPYRSKILRNPHYPWANETIAGVVARQRRYGKVTVNPPRSRFTIPDYIIKLQRCSDVKPYCEQGYIDISNVELAGATNYQVRSECFPHHPIFVSISGVAAAKIVSHLRKMGKSCGPYKLIVTVYPDYFDRGELSVAPVVFFEPSGVDFGPNVKDGITVQLPLYIDVPTRNLDAIMKTLSVHSTKPAFNEGIAYCDKGRVRYPTAERADWAEYSSPDKRPVFDLVEPFAGYCLMQAGLRVRAVYARINISHFTGFWMKLLSHFGCCSVYEEYLAVCYMYKKDIALASPDCYHVMYGFCRSISWSDTLSETLFIKKRPFRLPVGSSAPVCRFQFSPAAYISPLCEDILNCIDPIIAFSEGDSLNHYCSDIRINCRTNCRFWCTTGGLEVMVPFNFEVIYPAIHDLKRPVEQDTVGESASSESSLSVESDSSDGTVPLDALNVHGRSPGEQKDHASNMDDVGCDATSSRTLVSQRMLEDIDWYPFRELEGVYGASARGLVLYENSRSHEIYALKLVKTGIDPAREANILRLVPIWRLS